MRLLQTQHCHVIVQQGTQVRLLCVLETLQFQLQMRSLPRHLLLKLRVTGRDTCTPSMLSPAAAGGALPPFVIVKRNWRSLEAALWVSGFVGVTARTRCYLPP